MDKKIRVICHNCAKETNSPYNKWAIWMWTWICDICKEETFVADAYHDYWIDEDGNIISAEKFSLSNSI